MRGIIKQPFLEQHTIILPLLFKQLQGTLTTEDAATLDAWRAASPWNQALLDDLQDDVSLQEQLWLVQPAHWAVVEDAMLLDLQGRIAALASQARVVRLRRIWWRVAAAVAILAVGLGLYFYMLPSRPGKTGPTVVQTPAIIQPGQNGAVLTLADGRQVVLDSLGNGVVAQQSGATAVLQDGRLVYDPGKDASGAIVYNTMRTPRGRQFQLTLPDGTRVWLNAASSIRYPTTFSGTERTVDVKGEAYFEVAANPSQPFYARINDSTRVAVLGTSFNVNAYANEATINTTLLDGKVNLVLTAGTVPLRPGQQAQVQGGNTKVVQADVEQVMAWKNGQFYFEGASLAEIMRQIERWYDVAVIYPQGIPEITLHGKMTRGVTLQGLLRGLQSLGLHTDLTGNTLVILP